MDKAKLNEWTPWLKFDELLNTAVSFKEGEDWITERKGFAEIEQTIMEEGEELPYT